MKLFTPEKKTVTEKKADGDLYTPKKKTIVMDKPLQSITKQKPTTIKINADAVKSIEYKRVTDETAKRIDAITAQDNFKYMSLKGRIRQGHEPSKEETDFIIKYEIVEAKREEDMLNDQ